MKNPLKKVLVVEDDGALLNILSDGLVKLNYDVLKAADGQRALDLAMEAKPDLILLDLLLPKMDGYKVLEKIRHHEDQSISSIKVVVLSNLWSDKDILKAQALKIEEYYVKSNASITEIFAKIKELVPAGQE